MRRLLLLLLCLILLCGCGAPAQNPTVPPETIPAETQTCTEPADTLHDPGHALETDTRGALTVCPLGQCGAVGLSRFGDDLLLYTTSGLTKINETQLRVTAEIETDIIIFPEDPAVQSSEKGMTYYDFASRQLVFLDTALQEVRRMDFPEDMQGEPALSADRKHLYYFTPEGLRAQNLDTGLDRLVRQMSYPLQQISGLHCSDQILEYTATDQDDSWIQAFVDVTTGELIRWSSEEVVVHTEADRYFATAFDGSYTEKLTGTADSDVMMFYIPYLDVQVFPLLKQNAVVTVAADEDHCIIDYYDLADGTRPYSLTLPHAVAPSCMVEGASGESVWILISGYSEEQDLLCRWNLASSAIDDDTVYVGIRRTAENPDEYGLRQCAETAAEISRDYGVEVLLWQDALEVQPWDYYLEEEYQVLPIRNALETLRQVLSTFPEDFFREAVSQMGDGTLRISLVRSIWGVSDSGSLDNAVGIQFWEEDTGNAYLCIQIGYELERTLYHELFHVMESRIISTCNAFDNWTSLNPPGFEYDYNYSDYPFREDFSLITGDTRAFIDSYSMSFPKEDRARILEYACTPGCEDYFQSEALQLKLHAICLGIRQAYGLEDYPEPFLWEQYLSEPLYPIT